MTKKKPKSKPETSKVLLITGKRKRAIARAIFKSGSGIVRINGKPLESIDNEMVRFKIKEPLVLAGDAWKKYNINVNVHGGGVIGQSEAISQSIAKGLAGLLGDEMRKTFLSYNRNLLVSDPRRTEPHKPPRSSQGPRRYKQRSKR